MKFAVLDSISLMDIKGLLLVQTFDFDNGNCQLFLVALSLWSLALHHPVDVPSI